MENRRRSSRIHISRDIFAYHNDVLIIRSRSGNICPFGMFLDCGYSFLDREMKLDVTFTLEALHYMETFNLPVTIVHTHRNGLGLKFNHSDKETPMTLEQMLKAA